jgi:SAM-dependent methyltransferase
MTTTTAHYATHLGPIYLWMVGDLKTAFERSRAELEELRLPSVAQGVAIDLGAGFGLHSLPLAERGFTVTAIDTCDALLDELRARSASLPITTIVGDLLDFRSHLQQPADVIVCMGDTLTHLPDFAAVDSLLDSIAATLGPAGVFATTFRDYASRVPQWHERFIPVRSDEDRILTCFLEYGDERVVVHDLLHERDQGHWRQRVSRYVKLRLPPSRVVERLAKGGLAVRQDVGVGGMTRVVGVRQ